MHRFIRIVTLFTLLLATTAMAAAPAQAGPLAPPSNPRLVLFEAFLRPNGCANSAAAAPVVDQLAGEYAGEAVFFLEYDVDKVPNPRIQHWFAAFGSNEVTLPLAMAESGFQLSNGFENYHSRYSEMIDSMLDLPAMAELSATWKVVGGAAQVSTVIRNTSGFNLTTANHGHLHVIAYTEGAPESSAPRSHLTHRYAVGSYEYPLALNNGAQTTVPATIQPIPGHSWETVKFIVLVDAIPTRNTTNYLSLQAAHATRDGGGSSEPTSLSVVQSRLGLVALAADTGVYAQGLQIVAPATMAWSVTVNAARPVATARPAATAQSAATASSAAAPPWLEVGPTSGAGSATLQISIRSADLELGAQQAVIVVSSPGGQFTPITIPVTAVKTSLPPVFLPVVRK